MVASSPYSAIWDTKPLTDGLYDLRVVTTDNAGNIFTSVIDTDVQVDNSAPILSFGVFTNASATDATVYFLPGSSGTFTVTATPTEQQQITEVDFPSLGSGWTGGGAVTSAPYDMTYTFDGSAVEPGSGQGVTVADTAMGVSRAALFTVSAESTAPTSTISCNAGACSAGWYPGTVSITLAGSDAGSGVAEIRYTTDGTDPSTGPVYSGAFDISATSTVKFRAYDQVGNEGAIGSQLVQIDSSAPTGSITSPTGGATVSGTGVAITSDSADTGGSGLASAVFRYSPAGAGTWTSIGTDTTSPYSVAWNTTPLTAGSYDLEVLTTDNAGNTFTSATESVQVLAPFTFTVGKAKITAHGKKAFLTMTEKLSNNATVRSTLYKGKKVIAKWKSHGKAGSHKLKLSLSKTKLKKGRYKLVLKATSADSRQVQRKLNLKVPAKIKRV
jgi:methionine-rich copper-binding protein CopC